MARSTRAALPFRTARFARDASATRRGFWLRPSARHHKNPPERILHRTLGHWRFRSSAVNNGHMASYVGAERASSTDPRDWGRALAVALERLLEAARLDGRYAQHEHLCGVDLVLRIEEDGDGANVAVRWVPEEDGVDDGEKEKLAS